MVRFVPGPSRLLKERLLADLIRARDRVAKGIFAVLPQPVCYNYSGTINISGMVDVTVRKADCGIVRITV